MLNYLKFAFIPALLLILTFGCNQSKPAQPPSGMVLVPGGINKNGEKMKPFFMDASPVTVAQFDAFVKATGYITEAQKFGNSGVFDTATHSWSLVNGAD